MLRMFLEEVGKNEEQLSLPGRKHNVGKTMKQEEQNILELNDLWLELEYESGANKIAELAQSSSL